MMAITTSNSMSVNARALHLVNTTPPGAQGRASCLDARTLIQKVNADYNHNTSEGGRAPAGGEWRSIGEQTEQVQTVAFKLPAAASLANEASAGILAIFRVVDR